MSENIKAVVAGDTLVVTAENNISFAASKYNPETDPHFPKVGSTFDVNGSTMEIKKAKFYELGELMKMEKPDLEGHSDIIVIDNPVRPFVKYLAWCDKI